MYTIEKASNITGYSIKEINTMIKNEVIPYEKNSGLVANFYTLDDTTVDMLKHKKQALEKPKELKATLHRLVDLIMDFEV